MDKKQQIIDAVLKEFGDPYCEKDNDYYNFSYKRNWQTSSYQIYLSFDQEDFFASVQGATNASYGSGIIDFGGTERVRKKLISSLSKLVAGK